MRSLASLLALAAVGLFACSSNTPTSTSGSAATTATAKPSGTQAAKHGEHEEHGEHHDEHGDLGAPLTAFHDVLAPLWHGAKGDPRTASTCAAAADLHDRALAVDSAGPPANAQSPDLYKERAKKLIVTVDDLGTECAKAARPDFETKFAAVHDAFHGVMEASAPK